MSLGDLKKTGSNSDFVYYDINKPMDKNQNLRNNTTEFSETFQRSMEPDDAQSIIRGIKIKNINRLMIGCLNINSLASKFDLLKEIISNNLDILVKL